jgi:hypothetical protein
MSYHAVMTYWFILQMDTACGGRIQVRVADLSEAHWQSRGLGRPVGGPRGQCKLTARNSVHDCSDFKKRTFTAYPHFVYSIDEGSAKVGPAVTN